MGLFGSSRKKAHDPFQDAIEHHQRGKPAPRSRERQWESARQRTADHSHCDRSLAWHEGSNEHPYKQPGFGFYSGENLTASTPWQREPTRTMGVGGGYGIMPPRIYSDPLMWDPLASPHQGCPWPSFHDGDGYDAGGPPWRDPDPLTGSWWWDSPYTDPEEPLPYRDCGLLARVPPLGGPLSSDSRPFLPRSVPPEGWMYPEYPERPSIDHLRPCNNEPTPYFHAARSFTGNVPFDCDCAFNQCRDHAVDTFSGIGAPNRSPRPPGSYERLRPPHLEQGRDGA